MTIYVEDKEKQVKRYKGIKLFFGHDRFQMLDINEKSWNSDGRSEVGNRVLKNEMYTHRVGVLTQTAKRQICGFLLFQNNE